ncbi:MAG: sensor domain-containing diguanylate cyclase [Gammaproteobacteria bacterium]|nr:MAG: sensor domain-containing diguanylate cyclase [Gammaproteobacteria bacterium]
MTELTGTATAATLRELHWLMDMVHSLDAGLVILDRDQRVHLWNRFMENHSGIPAERILGRSLRTFFPDDPPPAWLDHKMRTVLDMNLPSFTIWRQRPYLFRFPPPRPFSSRAEHMYQNVTMLPLRSADTAVRHVGIILYDVTESALARHQLEEMNQALEKLSRTDRLTGLYNRGFWEECLEAEFRRFRRTRQPATLVLFDIDHFKQINDTWGHQAGDAVLRRLAQTTRESIRTTDIAGRYGGEEFAILLVDTEETRAVHLAERLRQAVERLEVPVEDGCIRFTISLGISQVREQVASPQEWIRCADLALYQAKHEGRNRYVVRPCTDCG